MLMFRHPSRVNRMAGEVSAGSFHYTDMHTMLPCSCTDLKRKYYQV